MIRRVVILGGHIQALGLARQVATRDLDVVLIIDSIYSVAKFSKYVNKTILCSSSKEIYNALDMLCLPNCSTLLFPTNDEMVELLSKNYNDYVTRFSLGIPNPKIINLFNNKRLAYKFAVDNNIPCPKCWYINTIDDVKFLNETLPYPVVVKPAIMYSFHKMFGKKAFRCNNSDELLNIFSKISLTNYPLNQIIIQEFLDGGAENLYSFGVMAVEGKPLVSIQANRIRQNPMDFGNSTTFAITCNIPQICNQSKQLLSIVNYFGLGEVEWMYDKKSKQYKFLEINTRAWKWHTISNQLGFSFIGTLIDYYNGTIFNAPIIDKKVGWVERLTDWTVICKEVLRNKMNFKDAVRSYRIKKENAVFSWKDPLPAIMYCLMSPILYFKRY